MKFPMRPNNTCARWGTSLVLALACCSGSVAPKNGSDEADPGDTDLPGASEPLPDSLQEDHRDRIADLQKRAQEVAEARFPGTNDGLLPRRLWRLTVPQIESAIERVLGRAIDLSDVILPTSKDARYDNNARLLVMNTAETEAMTRVGGKVYDLAREALPETWPCFASGVDEPCIEARLEAAMSQLLRGRDDAETRQAALALYSDLRADHQPLEATAGVLEYLVQTPAFLYRFEVGSGDGDTRTLTSNELASALSFFLSAEAPADWLLKQSEDKDLSDPKVIDDAAKRLLTDERFIPALSRFLSQWLGYEYLGVIEKDKEKFPAFTAETRAEMLAEVEDFIRYIFEKQNANFIVMLTSQRGFRTEALAHIYENDERGEAEEDLKTRSGIILLPGVLTARSGNVGTDPMQRAHRLLDRLFCVEPRKPVGISLEPPSEGGTGAVTIRDRFAQHTADPSCAGCHDLLDPIAFALEAYDPLGRYRTEEEGHSIDTSGTIDYTADAIGGFETAVEMLQKAAFTSDVQGCFVQQMYEFVFGTEPRPEAEPTLRSAYEAFVRSGFDMKTLIRAMVGSEHFRMRRAG